MIEEKTLKQLRDEAFEALHMAEVAMYKYASALDLGESRVKAFSCFENIRLAWRNS